MMSLTLPFARRQRRRVESGKAERPPSRRASLDGPFWAAAGVLGLAALALTLPPKGSRRGAGEHRLTQLTLGEWKRIFVGATREFMDDRIQEVAAGVTFFVLLAMFPAIAALVSLYGLFTDPSDVSWHVSALAGVLPGDIVRFISGEMQRLAEGQKSGLGLAFLVSLVISLWSANSGVKALLSGLNIAYEVRERRNFLILNLVSLTFTGGALAMAVVAIAAANAPRLALLGMIPSWAGRIATTVAMLAVLIAAVSVVYRYGPSRPRARWRWVTPGSAVAIMAWFAVSSAFSFYVGHLAHYERTYGSLGAAIAFMVWLWLSLTVLLFGAELNAEVELRTKGLPADEIRPRVETA
jgi:membrane protein